MTTGSGQLEGTAVVPMVRVVIINFDGGQMTLECLDSVLATHWPTDRLEIVLVDNGSLDDVADIVGREPRFSRVTLLEPLANLGFAAGCNLGIEHPGEYDYVALLNNDARVEPGWLAALVAAFDDPDRPLRRARPFDGHAAVSGGRIGAVSPKMLFADRSMLVDVQVPDAGPILSGDPRHLGVRVTAVRLDGRRIDDRVDFDEGFFGFEVPDRTVGEELARWSMASGAVRIAVDESAEEVPVSVALRLVSLAPRTVTVSTPVESRTVSVGDDPIWVEVRIDPTPLDVINNVGSELYLDGFAGDRGFLEVDRGQYDTDVEVFAWCGGAVLLSREYLDDVGLFDERLFLYYEDTDLAWRARLRGWRHIYTSATVVRHHHGASAGAHSDVFRFHTERNRLLVLAKNAPLGMVVRSAIGELRRLVVAVGRHFVIRPLTLRLPARIEVTRRWQVTRSYFGLLPSMLKSRRALGPVDRSAPMAWQVDKWGQG